MKKKELTPEMVRKLEPKLTYKQIAQRLGISKVYLYVLRKSWGMVKKKGEGK